MPPPLAAASNSGDDGHDLGTGGSGSGFGLPGRGGSDSLLLLPGASTSVTSVQSCNRAPHMPAPGKYLSY